MNSAIVNEISKRNKITTKKMVLTGMLGAVSAILMAFSVSVPLAPSFVKLDFSELPVILGGFMMGPLAGYMIILIKIILNLIINGTSSMFVGEFANALFSTAYMLPAVLIYYRFNTRKGVLTGLICGTIITSITVLFGNLYLIFPIYAKLYGMSIDAIVAMGRAANPFVKDMFSLMLFSMLPFNLFKYGICSIIILAVYKKISRIFGD